MSSSSAIVYFAGIGNVGTNIANADQSHRSGDTAGTVVGGLQVGQAVADVAASGRAAAPAVGLAGATLGVAGIVVSLNNIETAHQSNTPVQVADLIGIAGGVLGVAGGVAVIVGASGPIVVGLAVVGIGVGALQLVSTLKGWQLDRDTGQLREITLNPDFSRQIQESLEAKLAQDGRTLHDVLSPYASPNAEKMCINPAVARLFTGMSWPGTDTAQDPSEVIESLQTIFTQAEKTSSPLILDLDGLNGVETLGKTAGIHFDHDGNKFAEQTGWVGKNDGLLVWDKNGNGQIDNGAELFGNNTVLKNGSKADNGFSGLADLDSNKDGKVDANDAASSQLRVFKDANSNGVVDAGELMTLAQAGVKSLSTGYTSQATTDANGNQHLQAGSFTTTAGQTRAMDDVWFAVDTARTIDTDLVAVNSTIAALPDIEGFGNVHSLHQAMARDASGKLQALVQKYAGASDAAVRASLLNDIIYRWTGVQDIDPASRANTQGYGNIIGDARRLATLEAFLGESYLGTSCLGEKDPNPHGRAAPLLLSAYDHFAQWVDGQLLAQTVFEPLYESLGLSWDADKQSLEWDVGALVVALKAQYNANPAQGQGLIASFAKSLDTMEEAGAQIAFKLRQQGNIKGQGFELYLATMGGNPLVGTAGADTLYAKAGLDNVFNAGKGADVLNGGNGSDTFIWSKGDGNDTINEMGDVDFARDTLQFLDANASEVRLSRRADDLYITIGAEQIKVVNHFGTAPAALEQIQFSDGSMWQKSVLDAAPSLYLGTSGNETLRGTSLADIFEGGKGADTLYGGAGGDTYTWLKGDGNDTINDIGLAADVDTLELADVRASDVQLSRDQVNLYVTIGAEKITVMNHFSTLFYEAAPIEQILFADGVKWQKVDLEAPPYRGTAAKDTISGTAQAENLIGGLEADTLVGGAGSDCYLWQKGEGNDTINDVGAAADVDTLKLLDVKSTEAQLGRDTLNLYVTIGAEKITIKNHFSPLSYEAAPIEQILFSDGGRWQKADFDFAPYRGTAAKDTISGTAQAENFIGGLEADTLVGGAGSDCYLWQKGEGNDTINDVGAAADVDTLKLLDVKAAEVQLSRDSVNLYVTIGAEKIAIKNHFSTLSYEAAPIEQIQFADGSKWLKADLDAAPYRGGDGAETIYGTAAAETFIGGKGADVLWGGTGNDCYFWSKGEGNDTINDVGLAADVDTLKLLDVKATEIQLSRDSVNLYVIIGAEKITIKNHFSTLSYEAAPIEQILFADGSKWLKADLDAAPYRGGDGAETIYGTAAAETFIGGKGADVLWGGTGNDCYFWSKGEGNDTINDVGLAADVDTLKLLDVKATEIQLSRDSVNLYVIIGAEKITIKNHFSTLSYEAAPIEQILFADGSKWQKADLDAFMTWKSVIIGTADKATVQNWYLGNAYHVEQIKSGDGKLLQDTQVDKLVQAMAAFAPPAMGQTSLTAAQQTALAPVLAANWH
jgi:Ca2+-binding RTX toxin-like protein